jgi:diguanylate cyclase (GGDEF)-like protein
VGQPWIRSGFLRTKVARRTLLLFVLSALLPVGALVSVGYFYVSGKLIEISSFQLRENAKNVSVHIYERLRNLRAALITLRDGIGTTHTLSVLPRAEQFRGVALQTGNAMPTTLWGGLNAFPDIDGAVRAKLEVSDTVLLTDARGGRNHMWLLTPSVGVENAVLIAEINPEYVWAVRETMPYGFAICILDQHSDKLFCSETAPEELMQPVKSRQAVEQHAFQDQRFWTFQVKLFLKEHFAVPAWTVVVLQEKSEALSDWQVFRQLFTPIILVTLLLVVLLSTMQIRRNTVPLDRLRDKTKRIAAGDFGGQIQVDSGDEFEELAGSFNAMAMALDHQFTTLNTMSDIDRLILSSASRAEIRKIVIQRFPDVLPCCSVGLSTVDATGNARITALKTATSTPRHVTQSGASQLPAAFRTDTGYFTVDCDEGEVPAWLAPSRLAGCRYHHVFPIEVDGELQGLLGFGFFERNVLSDDEIRHATTLRDRLAVAFAEIQSKEKLYVQSHYDALTQLPNRSLFEQLVATSLRDAKRSNINAAVMFLDIDRFKSINDSLGHGAGDRLIKELGRRLAGVLVGPGQHIARLSGDEFIVVVPGLETRDKTVTAVTALAARLLENASKPVAMETQEFRVSASIGIALYPSDGTEYSELLRNADSAMYSAKEKGGQQFQFFSPELHSSALEQFHIESDLPRAMADGQLQLYYQPQFDARSGNLVGAEALMRWNHPSRGLMMPKRFIPIATSSGIIMRMEEWAIMEACQQAQAWHQDGLGQVKLAVNLSARQLLRRDLADVIAHALEASGLPARSLAVEITEGSLVIDTLRSNQTLSELRELGISVAVDDFGVGYSSLSYLRSLPIDTLKIDRSFVADIQHNESSAAITASIISLAHALKLDVVAEGVETETQFEFLQEAHCDIIQGYLLGHPVPAQQFALLHTRPPKVLAGGSNR